MTGPELQIIIERYKAKALNKEIITSSSQLILGDNKEKDAKDKSRMKSFIKTVMSSAQPYVEKNKYG